MERDNEIQQEISRTEAAGILKTLAAQLTDAAINGSPENRKLLKQSRQLQNIVSETAFPETFFPRFTSFPFLCNFLSPDEIEILRLYYEQEKNKVERQRPRLQHRTPAPNNMKLPDVITAVREKIDGMMDLPHRATVGMMRSLVAPDQILPAMREHLGDKVREILGEEIFTFLADLEQKAETQRMRKQLRMTRHGMEKSAKKHQELPMEQLIGILEEWSDEAEDVFSDDIEEDDYDKLIQANTVLGKAVSFCRQNLPRIQDLQSHFDQNSVRNFFYLLNAFSKYITQIRDADREISRNNAPVLKIFVAFVQFFGSALTKDYCASLCNDMPLSTALAHIRNALKDTDWILHETDSGITLLLTNFSGIYLGESRNIPQLPELKPFVNIGRAIQKGTIRRDDDEKDAATRQRLQTIRRSIRGDTETIPPYVPDRYSLTQAISDIETLDKKQIQKLLTAALGWIHKEAMRHYSAKGTSSFKRHVQKMIPTFEKLPAKLQTLRPVKDFMKDAHNELTLDTFVRRCCKALDSMPGKIALETAYRILEVLHNSPDTEQKPAPLIYPHPVLTIPAFRETVARDEMPEDLWRNQRDMEGGTLRGLEAGWTRQLLDSPPGTGKTRVIIELAQRLNWHGRNLLLSPTRDVARQSARHLAAAFGHNEVGIIDGNGRNFNRPILSGTYATFQAAIMREPRAFQQSEFGVVFFDEAHRTLSQQRQMISRTLADAIVIATSGSTRGIYGNRDLADTYDLVYRMSLRDGIKCGLINPMQIWTMNTRPGMQERIAHAVKFYETHSPGEQALVIARTIHDAEEAAAAFNRRGISARAVHSHMDSDGFMPEISEIDFQNGKFRVLTVCKMFTEGWDMPPLTNEIILDIPFAPWMIEQWIGRISRCHDGKSPSRLCLMFSPVEEERYLKAKTAIWESLKIDPEDWNNGDFLEKRVKGFWPQNALKI